MSHKWDEQIQKAIKTQAEQVEFSQMEKQRMLSGIHGQIRKRGVSMRHKKKKTFVIAAAALLAMGTITAIAAGRAASLITVTSRDDVITSREELIRQSTEKMGQDTKFIPQFSNGAAFVEGYVTTVEGQDDQGNKLGDYPSATASYGADHNINLDIDKPGDWLEEDMSASGQEVVYGAVRLYVSQHNYLFLPPDQKPSEADLKLEEEGKLSISYGSSQEERYVFKNVQWRDGDLNYLLFTKGDTDLETLTEMAKEVVDWR